MVMLKFSVVFTFKIHYFNTINKSNKLLQGGFKSIKMSLFAGCPPAESRINVLH